MLYQWSQLFYLMFPPVALLDWPLHHLVDSSHLNQLLSLEEH